MAFLVTMLLGIGTTTAFDLTCPNGISWKLRAKMFCPEKESYHCLHETYYDIYIEQCLNSTLSGEGRHYVVSGNLDSEECPFNTYSPSLEWSNGSANCRYKKSFCTEEGQKTAFHGSSKRDRSCRCDFTKQYDYLTRPMDPSNCFPILEDCSCYVRQCLRTDEFLTPDYECKRSNSQHVFSCPFVHDSRDENCNNKTEVHRDNFTKETSRLQEYYFDNVNRKTVGWVMVAMALITIILSVFFIIKQHKSTKCNKPKKKTKLQKPPAPKEIFHEELYTVTYFQPTKQQEEMKHAFDSDKHGVLLILEDKMEKESRHYTWIFLPLLNIQCAKFLLLSSNRKDIEQAKTIFQKAISLEESRRVFWTRFMHEGYHGLLLCLGKLGEKEEADKIFKGIKLKLEDKNRDRIISMLESLKYDNWD